MNEKYKHSPETGIRNLVDRLYDSRYLNAHHSFESVAALCEEAGQELLEYINAMNRIRKLQAENARLLDAVRKAISKWYETDDVYIGSSLIDCLELAMRENEDD